MSVRAGLVAVVGRPNVGKSTLVNAMVGRKVSIVSDKPQTTRLAVRGVVNAEGSQIVLTDTPGFHKPRTPLGERLNIRVGEAASDVDVVLMVVDAAAGIGRGDQFVATNKIVPHRGMKVCVLNKVDLLRHHDLPPHLEAAARLAPFDHVVPASAKTGGGLGELLTILVESLPSGEPLFPAGQVTDQSLEVQVAEIVREKALAVTEEEVPHSIAVTVEEMERQGDGGLVRITCVLFVERQSQKGIVIGKGGRLLKEIGTQARRELEDLLGSKVFLELRVKVLKEWQRDPAAMTRLGL